MLVSTKPGADYSVGCARPAMRPPISATHPTPRYANRLWRYALTLLRQSGFLLVANTAFLEDFYSPTLGNERLPSGLRPHPGDTPRNKPTYVQSVIHNGRVHASSRKGGSVMFARVSQYSVDPERLQQEQGEVEEHLLPALRMQPGFSGGLLLANPQKGKVLAVTLWESEQEMHATDEASHWFRVFGAAAVEGTVTDVETYEVYRAQLSHPEP